MSACGVFCERTKWYSFPFLFGDPANARVSWSPCFSLLSNNPPPDFRVLKQQQGVNAHSSAVSTGLSWGDPRSCVGCAWTQTLKTASPPPSRLPRCTGGHLSGRSSPGPRGLHPSAAVSGSSEQTSYTVAGFLCQASLRDPSEQVKASLHAKGRADRHHLLGRGLLRDTANGRRLWRPSTVVPLPTPLSGYWSLFVLRGIVWYKNTGQEKLVPWPYTSSRSAAIPG